MEKRKFSISRNSGKNGEKNCLGKRKNTKFQKKNSFKNYKFLNLFIKIIFSHKTSVNFKIFQIRKKSQTEKNGSEIPVNGNGKWKWKI